MLCKSRNVCSTMNICIYLALDASSQASQFTEGNFILHWENYISISFHIEWDMIVVTVFLSILNPMEFHLVHIPFGSKRSFVSKYCLWISWRLQISFLCFWESENSFRFPSISLDCYLLNFGLTSVSVDWSSLYIICISLD